MLQSALNNFGEEKRKKKKERKNKHYDNNRFLQKSFLQKPNYTYILVFKDLNRTVPYNEDNHHPTPI
jgi:hypothetical protein